MSNKDEFQKFLQIVHPDEYSSLGIAIQKELLYPISIFIVLCIKALICKRVSAFYVR